MTIGETNEWEFTEIPFKSTDQIRCFHLDNNPQFCELVSTYLRKICEDITAMGEAHAQIWLDRLIDDPGDRLISDYEMPVERKINAGPPQHL